MASVICFQTLLSQLIFLENFNGHKWIYDRVNLRDKVFLSEELIAHYVKTDKVTSQNSVTALKGALNNVKQASEAVLSKRNFV